MTSQPAASVFFPTGPSRRARRGLTLLLPETTQMRLPSRWGFLHSCGGLRDD